MERQFCYQRFDLRNLIGIIIGAGLLGVCMLLMILTNGPKVGYAFGGMILFVTFPTLIWPALSSDMKCFYGTGSYTIEDDRLVLKMGKKIRLFDDIDEVYISGPREGGGQMLGAVTSFDGGLEIKQGRKKVQIITTNMWHDNKDVEESVQKMFNDIVDHFSKLKPAHLDNGTVIRGYYRKESLN